MAVDTPARIGIIGAGPIGLEAALYARYLGYETLVFDRGAAAQHLVEWGHVRMFSPFGLNRTPLGLAALRAQNDAWQPPSDDALLTGRQLREQYYLPLAESDLLADGLHPHTTVLGVGRTELLKGDLVGDDARGDFNFRLLTCDHAGREAVHVVDVVLDCSGVYGQPNWLGHGGLPALGESNGADQIEYQLPDVLGDDREKYAHQHTLVVGAGFSAATTVVALAELAEHAPGTRVTWVTRRELDSVSSGPVTELPDDRLAERKRLAQAANALARQADGPVRHVAGVQVESIEYDAQGWHVKLTDAAAGVIEADRVVAHVGYRPDTRLFELLQVQLCHASDGPLRLAASLAKQQSADCLDATPTAATTIATTEPNFYVLGAKSYGRDPRFLLMQGFRQIRDVFSIIADRADLDLYARVSGLST